MSVRLSTIPTNLPRTTVRDVLKTLVEIDIRRQIDQATGVAPEQRAKLSTDLTSDPPLDQQIESLVDGAASDRTDIPIQVGFGLGAGGRRRKTNG